MPLEADDGLTSPEAAAVISVSDIDDSPYVLVVEDNPINQLLAAAQLERLGCTHRIAPTGIDALRALEAEQFDLVQMDLQLPDIDGLETTRRWRAREATIGAGRIPIVGVTARAMTGDAERCIDAGMDGFVVKPVTLNDLAGVIREHLQRPTPNAGADEPTTSATEQTLARLLADLDDPDLVATLVDTYLGELDRRRAALREAAEGGDADGVRRVAHTLKSTSAIVGAEPLRELMHDIEGRVADGALDFPELAGPLDELIAATKGELTTALSRVISPDRRSPQ